MSDPLLTAEDVAERLSVSRTTAYELMHRLRPHVRIGQGRKTLIRLPQSTLDKYIAGEGDGGCDSSDEKTRRTGGSPAGTRTARAGARPQGSKADARRRKLDALLRDSG